MTQSRKQLELLAPAKNADIGIEAVNHGADAISSSADCIRARTRSRTAPVQAWSSTGIGRNTGKSRPSSDPVLGRTECQRSHSG